MSFTSLVRFWRLRPSSGRRGRPVVIRRKLRVEELEARELFAGSSALTDINYVAGLYYELLHRRPSSPEVSGWNGALAGGAGRAQVAAGFVGSVEYQARVIQGDYQTILHRNADSGGFQSWIQQMQGGVNAQQVMATFLASDEYYAGHGSNINGWLVAVYQDVLGRLPDAVGIANWSAVLITGVPRDAVAMGIVRSREALSRQIAKAYQEVLGRAPDVWGANSWTAAMQSGLTTEQLTVGLAASQEFYDEQKGVNFELGSDSRPKGPFHGDPRLPKAPIHPLGGDRGGGAGQSGGGGGSSGGGAPSGGAGGDGDRGSGGGIPGGQGGSGGGQGSGGSGGRSLGHVSGQNVNASQRPMTDHAEITLAVNPTNPLNIVVAGTPFDQPAGLPNSPPDYFATYYTMDGGETWNFVRVGAVVDRVNVNGSTRNDPFLAFDANGRLYFSYFVDDPFDPTGPKDFMLVLRSTDGGRNYTASNVLVDDERLFFDDKEILAIGPDPANPSQQNVYLGWVRFNLTLGQPDRIVIAGSTDGGVTWSPTTAVSDPIHKSVQFAYPSVGPAGEINISFMDLDSNQIFFASSPTFAGRAFAFGPEHLAVSVDDVFFMQSVPAQPSRGLAPLPVSITDTSNGPNRGRVYIAYTDIAKGGVRPDYDIFLVASGDHGATWSRPLRVNDDDTTNTQFNPAISIDRSGCLGLAWRDAREDFGNKQVDIFSATSTNGGQSFSPNFKISNAPSDESARFPPPGRNLVGFINNYLEYDGFEVLNGVGYYAWADNSANPNGNKQIFFDTRQLPCPAPGTTIPPFIIRPRDRFDPNDTSDTATLLASMSQTQAGLRITRHADGIFDNDWFRLSAFGNSITVSINYTTFDGGDLHLRVFTLDAQGTLIQLGSSRATGVKSQTVTVGVAPGQPILIWVYGFNHSEGDYDLTIA